MRFNIQNAFFCIYLAFTDRDLNFTHDIHFTHAENAQV